MITDGGYIDTRNLLDEMTPIDLSRRCDSVETRKTPSPYNSSAFGENSPSQLIDSPNSLPRSSNQFGSNSTHNRSDTPTNRYQAESYVQRNFSSPLHESTRYTYDSESTSSPIESIPLHQFMRQQSTGSDEEFNSFLLQALQQKLQNIPKSISTNIQHPSDKVNIPMLMNNDGKLTRPFKAYPRDPLTMAAGIPASDLFTDQSSAERFQIFRQQMLEQIHAANGGSVVITNPKMRRNHKNDKNERYDMTIEQQHSNIETQQQINDQLNTSNGNNDTMKDNAYYERRRKNNAAAKKSRDRRRIKEDEIAIRAAFLERENFELKIELETVKRQLATRLGK